MSSFISILYSLPNFLVGRIEVALFDWSCPPQFWQSYTTLISTRCFWQQQLASSVKMSRPACSPEELVRQGKNTHGKLVDKGGHHGQSRGFVCCCGIQTLFAAIETKAMRKSIYDSGAHCRRCTQQRQGHYCSGTMVICRVPVIV